MQGGVCYPLPTLARPTSGGGGGVFPTPMVADSDPSGGPPQSNANTKRWGGVNSLGQMAKTGLFPTPTATSYGTGNNYEVNEGQPAAHRPSLETMARKSVWPTPTVDGNYNRKGLSPTSGDGLATSVKAAMLPTPTVADAEGGRTTKGKDRPNEGGLQQAALFWPTPTARDYGVRLTRERSAAE